MKLNLLHRKNLVASNKDFSENLYSIYYIMLHSFILCGIIISIDHWTNSNPYYTVVEDSEDPLYVTFSIQLET